MPGAVADLVRVVFTRRNALTLVVMCCLALAGVVIPDRTLSYAAYLALFSVWMIGFVLTVVDLLRLRSGAASTG
jgi:energy-converting hydrogenase Eha subunit H